MIPISLIATAIGLGLAYAAAPGAVNTEALRRGVTRGARPVLLIESGSLIGDSLWAILALTGVTLLTRYLAVQIVLGITGGFFLLRLAWLALFRSICPARFLRASILHTWRFRDRRSIWPCQPGGTRLLVGSGQQHCGFGRDRLAVCLFLCRFLSRRAPLVPLHQRPHPLGPPLDSPLHVPLDQRPLRPCPRLFRHSRPLAHRARLVGASGVACLNVCMEELPEIVCRISLCY